MKPVYLISCCLLLLAGLLCPACSDDNPGVPCLTEEEYPRILGNWPERNATTGELGTQNAQVGVEMVISMMFTPGEYCEGIWYLDGVEYCRGTEFRFLSWYPATHHLRLVVRTPLYETQREANLIVK